jgi:hypothetical protein
MRRPFTLALLAASLGALEGSTLQQLSLEDMIRQSTLIVRGQPQLTYSQFRGSVIYTHFTLQVSKVYKGTAGKQLDLAVPGGMNGGMRQTFAGAPGLANGQDYVLFLWTSKTGLTQVIGLSQGLFVVAQDAAGNTIIRRAAATESMLNAAGQLVTSSDIQMSLSDLAARIQSVLAGGGQ